MIRPPPSSTLFPYTTLFRSNSDSPPANPRPYSYSVLCPLSHADETLRRCWPEPRLLLVAFVAPSRKFPFSGRSEEHTSELQSQSNLVCRLLLEKTNSASTSSGITTSSEDNPWRSAFREERARPSGVTGPCDFLPLARDDAALLCAMTMLPDPIT